MRLRNKKTGEIGKLHCDMNVSPAKYGVFEDIDIRGHYWEYDSLAELNSDWEDYKPKEPLIKDEKIRKAVRAWAEAQGLTEVYCANDGYEIYGGDDALCIQFDGEPFQFADKNRIYTITELCGEEE